MLLTKKNAYAVLASQANQVFSISGAIYEECDSRPEPYSGQGQLEALQAALEKTVSLLAEVTEQLHNKGVLTDAEILKMLPDFQIPSTDSE